MSEKSSKLNAMVAVFGGGKMGGALVRGWISANLLKPDNILVIEPYAPNAEALGNTGVIVESTPPASLSGFDAVIIAVKPQVLSEVLRPVADSLMGKLVISIAAGVESETLKTIAPKARWVRAMPNQPVTVAQGITGLFSTNSLPEADQTLVDDLFGAVGKTIWLQREVLMHAVTGLSGSGPAFVAVIAEAMEDAGVKAGLMRQDARMLALSTLQGTALQIAESGEGPATLKDAVTSPAGTTIAGVDALEASGGRAAIMAAIAAATARSQELDKNK